MGAITAIMRMRSISFVKKIASDVEVQSTHYRIGGTISTTPYFYLHYLFGPDFTILDSELNDGCIDFTIFFLVYVCIHHK